MTGTRREDPARPGLTGTRVLVTGSSGLIGRRLTAMLAARGARVLRLVRREVSGPEEFRWDPSAGRIELGDGAADAVVHLAGENIAAGRWTTRRKQEIRDSRVRGTRLLAEALAKMKTPPRVLVSASAIGFYGDRGPEAVDEDATQGRGFLAEVCAEWERAARPAGEGGIRVVHPRIGVVLAREGGVLSRLITPFRLGLGGKVGHGGQYMSWITIDDLVAVFARAIEDDQLAGPINATAPTAVTNLEFTHALGAALRRPTFLPLPAFAARILFGEMADALLLASTRVNPRRLLAAHFPFQHSDLPGALRSLLSAPRPSRVC